MSIDAMRWAWQQSVGKSGPKIVLLSLADRADESHCCHPSIARLERDTDLDRKTIINSLALLEERGLIADTGQRRGLTGKVKVYKLIGVPDRHNDSENGTIKSAKPKTKNSQPNHTGNGTIESYQKRDDSKNGMIPNFPCNGPENGTLNSTENGTQNLSLEPTKEPITPQQQCARGTSAPNSHETKRDVPRQTSTTDPFAITLDWEPVAQRFEDMLVRAGIPATSPWLKSWPDSIPEFVLYWLDEPAQCRQTQWEGKFLRQVQFDIRRAESRPAATRMSAEWALDDTALKILDRLKIDRAFAEDLRPEFVMFWIDAGGAALSWNAKFISHVKARWAERKPQQKTGAEVFDHMFSTDWAVGIKLTDPALEHQV